MVDISTPRKLKKVSPFDNDGFASWSNLNLDLLLLVMMQVGVFDFIAFSGVCKSWRSVAVSNWNKFMVSKQPMCLSISTRLLKKDCYLSLDLDVFTMTKRKLNTTIPHSNGRICVGVTCGFLIFFGKKTCDFWLVNLFTRKKLHFPGFPFAESTHPGYFRSILVFSPSMFGWVFVVLNEFPTRISFCLAGKHARWRNVTSSYHIHDLHFFKGKIYMINAYSQLWELRLNPEPTLTLQKMNNFPWPVFKKLAFVSSGEHLYVRDFCGDVSKVIEVDFDVMEWMSSERTLGEYAVFLSDFKCDAAIKPHTWTHPSTQYKRVNSLQNEKWGRGRIKHMWYFPHDCLNDNDPDMKNGGLLNILKE